MVVHLNSTGAELEVEVLILRRLLVLVPTEPLHRAARKTNPSAEREV